MLGKMVEQYRVAFVVIPNIDVTWNLNVNLGLYTRVKDIGSVSPKAAFKFSRKPLVVHDCYENNAVIVDSER
jgi:hypothetical protein